jgi:hypothetical protein
MKPHVSPGDFARQPKKPSISFCTTCANRLYQLEQQFTANARIIDATCDTEWVILNFGSKDGLHDYVLEKLASHSSRIVYARYSSAPAWHASIAKNLAHSLATGDILVNLDCDNLIGDAISSIRRFFPQGGQLVHLWSGIYGDGTYGRIAVSRDLFFELGGYDESLHHMGYQDTDLMSRAAIRGVPVLHRRCSQDLAIKNRKHQNPAGAGEAAYTWSDLNRLNAALSSRNIANGILRANPGKVFESPDGIEIYRGLLGGI